MIFQAQGDARCSRSLRSCLCSAMGMLRAAFQLPPRAESRRWCLRAGRTSAHPREKVGGKKSLLKLAKQGVWSEGSDKENATAVSEE